MRAKRRSFSAYLVEPFKQIRFGLHVVGVCLLFVSLLGYLYTMAFREQYDQVVEFFQVADKEDLINNDVFIRNGFLVGGTLLFFILTMMVVVIRRTHKMYGPMVSILRFVQEIARGNYAVRIHIRQKDDFQTLVTKLNELASILHKRHGISVEPKSLELDNLDKRVRDYDEGVIQVEHPNSQINSAS